MAASAAWPDDTPPSPPPTLSLALSLSRALCHSRALSLSRALSRTTGVPRSLALTPPRHQASS